MKVVQATGENRLEVVERPDPSDESRVVVRSVRAGICGTDLEILGGRVPISYPRVLGHEMVGTVVDADRHSFVEGSRVLIDPATTCGRCDQCRAGRSNTCRNGGLMGRDSDGLFSELVTVPEQSLHLVPEELSDDAASVLQVLGTCVHGQHGLARADTAVVVGLGVAGLIHLQLLKVLGLEQVIGVTRSDWKLDLAQALGATATVKPADAAQAVMDLTEGRGAAIVVEAVGTEATLAQAIELAGLGATVVAFGIITQGRGELPYYQLYHRDITIHHPRAAHPADYDRAIELAAGDQLDLASLVTHSFPLDEADQAFGAVKDPSALKVVLDFAA